MTPRVRRRALGAVLCLSFLLPALTVPSPVSAEPPQSWDLDPSTGRPYDFGSYPAPDGWQQNPSGPTMWAFWPVCTGTTLDDGTTYTGGRARYCIRAISTRRMGDTEWKAMTPRLQGAAPRPPAWSTDWSANGGRNGLGGQVGPSARIVNGWFGLDLWDGKNELDATVEYRAELNIGAYDMVAMRSVGAGGAYSQTKNPAGDNILSVSARPGANSVMIPPTDVCTNPTARATQSFKAAWSVTLFDRTRFARYAPYEGAVLESDAYPSSNDYFPVFDADTGSFRIKVCAPHYRDDGTLNVGYYRLVLTRAMLESSGYYLSDTKGRPLTDGRTLDAADRDAIAEKVSGDFLLSSSTQSGLSGKVKLLVAGDGAISVEISADVSYSAPTISLARRGPAVWRALDRPESGGVVTVRYRTAAKVSGTLHTELRTSSGRLVASSTKVVRSTTSGGTTVDVPKSAKAGKYVLKVYIAGSKINGKARITQVQSLPVSITKGG
ncbi:MAG: hypothetical protein RLZZ305_464 [Actinomycetota bacterium]